MKRNFAIVVTFVSVALALSSRPVRAAAVIVSDAGCLVLAGDCATPEAITGNFSMSSSGNSRASCEGQLPAGSPLPPDGAAHCDFASTGLSCSTTFGITDDWTETVTPSGQVNLTCHINGNR